MFTLLEGIGLYIDRDKGKLMLPTETEWRQMVDQEEHYLVDAIKDNLRTSEQRNWLAKVDLSIEDLLNGRYNPIFEKEVKEMYKSWNEKLGWKEFNA